MSVLVVTSLGPMLREERQRQNLTLSEISAHTRICVPILEAIEENHFDCVPAGWYRQSFLRQYAAALGLDAERVVAEFRRQYEEPPVPLPIPPRRKPRRIWADLTWAAVTVVALIGVYEASQATRAALKATQHLNSSETAASELTSPPAPAGKAARSESMDANASEPSTAAPAAMAPPSAPTPGVHVAIKATEPVWLSVKCDGDPKYTGVLDGPESKTFDASNAITAVIGNAGGLEISLNGHPVGPLGAHGEVQMLELTPAGARRISGHSD